MLIELTVKGLRVRRGTIDQAAQRALTQHTMRERARRSAAAVRGWQTRRATDGEATADNFGGASDGQKSLC